jgi:thymidylate synthase (FAD)
MPKVTLIDHTGKGRADERWHAAHVLIFTKATRLKMSPDLLLGIQQMPEEQMRHELAYMASTIPSSWEFVDVTFLLEGVTRACAQQITRTRQASYAMQSQRVVDASDCAVTNPFTEGSGLHARFEHAAHEAVDEYVDLVEAGAKKEDARGILPMNAQCNLVAKYHLRALVDLVLARKSLRTQGEYAGIVRDMEAAVLEAWPWAEPFFEPKQAKAIAMLEEVVKDLGMNVGSGPGWQIAKAIDLIRKG